MSLLAREALDYKRLCYSSSLSMTDPNVGNTRVRYFLESGVCAYAVSPIVP
jgi:hypothetical protein